MSALDVGVCGWCIDRHDVCRGIEVAGRELGVPFVQIGFFSCEDLRRANAAAIARIADVSGVALTGTFVGFDGEDYSSIARIADTGGFTPDDVYPARLEIVRVVAALTANLGARALTVHAATIPSDPAMPLFGKLVSRVREVADVTGAVGVRLLLETGREPVDCLVAFMDALDCDNVAVNLDAGNLVVYGSDDPVGAVSKLEGWIEGVHLKDAQRSAKPGLEYGSPAPFGTGDVQIARVVSKLRAAGYRGPLLAEVKAPGGDLDATRAAIEYLRTLT